MSLHRKDKETIDFPLQLNSEGRDFKEDEWEIIFNATFILKENKNVTFQQIGDKQSMTWPFYLYQSGLRIKAESVYDWQKAKLIIGKNGKLQFSLSLLCDEECSFPTWWDPKNSPEQKKLRI